jgi:hypothetical protein
MRAPQRYDSSAVQREKISGPPPCRSAPPDTEERATQRADEGGKRPIAHRQDLVFRQDAEIDTRRDCARRS